MKSFLALTAVIATGCMSEQTYGNVAPTHLICRLGGFHQELVLAPDFRIDRIGDDAYPPDDVVRDAFAADARLVAQYSKCTTPDVGVLRLVLRRIEVGSSRSVAGRLLAWILVVPTLGFSSIYPFTEDRWLTIELDADVTVGTHRVWTGEFTSTANGSLMQKPSETGTQLSVLFVRVQESAMRDLETVMGTK